ncbi:MAG: alanine racemase [Actinobacteria bacterium]|nr:alanine racemase [Actinomycetota bacterium]MCL5446571.1 alanine racemase [Actinomycetota bacterium]
MRSRWTPENRYAWVEIDLGAVRHNVSLLARMAAPAAFCAVVKANAYGHGAPQVAEAAVSAGAGWLAVAFGEEAVEIREYGVTAPILLLQELPDTMSLGEISELVNLHVTPTVYSRRGIEKLGRATAGLERRASVHLKMDTGMHRAGASAIDLPGLLGVLERYPVLQLTGLWSHLAVADGDSSEDIAFTGHQVDLLTSAAGSLPERVMLHLANSAGAIAHPDSRLSMVRCGIAIYGESPSDFVTKALERYTRDATATTTCATPTEPATATPTPYDAVQGLVPAMSLKARVAYVRELEAGESISYGRRYTLAERSIVATVPLGYADGVSRRLFAEGGSVLLKGRRMPIAGTVTMDQIMVDCGPDADISIGDEVVIMGGQEGNRIGASEVAAKLGTISYEVLCSISARVPRIYLNS